MNTQTAPKLLFRYFDPSENFTPKHEPFRLFIRREVETPDKLEVLNLETLTRQRRDDWRRMFYQLDERTGFTKDGKEIRYFVLDLPDPLRWKNLSAVTRRNLQLDYSPLAVIRVDEKGIEGIDPKGRTWFVPTVPTAEELAETFVATLAELPEQERRAFVDWHLNNPHEQHGPTHREFVEGVRKIYETDALFHGRNRPAVRRVLKEFIQGEGEILPEQQPVRENFVDEQPVKEKPVELFLLEYGEKNAEVIRTLYDGLNEKLFNVPFEQWERHFTDNGQPFQPIVWTGKITQLLSLFQGIKLRTNRIYVQIAQHFQKEGGGSFDTGSMSVLYSKAKPHQVIVSELLKKVSTLVRT